MLKPKPVSNFNTISRHFPHRNSPPPIVHRRLLDPTHQPIVHLLLTLLRHSPTRCCVKQVHAQMVLHQVHKPGHLLSKVIHLRDFPYASLVFASIPHPNEFAFNIMIRALATTWREYHLAIWFYYRMRLLGLRPDNFTYPFLFVSCGNVSAVEGGMAGHAMVVKSGLGGDGHVRHSLITMYARCGQLGLAQKVFDEIPERGLVSWNSMISGYSKMGFPKEAVRLFAEMREGGFVPDEMTLVSVLAACGDLADLGLGRWVEGYLRDKKIEFNSFVGSALINMYGKCGELASARRVFDQMAEKDVVTWNAMITGYAQNGESNEAIRLFDCMRKTCGDLNEITMVVVLSACATAGALDLGKWIEAFASGRGWQHDVYVASALIDMYAKCGSLDDARKVFENMSKKNEVSWNAMISAFAFHGKTQDALSLFRRMARTDVGASPNDITFVAVLSACVHAGLVDEGRQLFESMHLSFGLVPKIEHYSCMVDLLSRAGLIYEAWNIIETMPGKPDEIALGALLGACEKCKNVEVGERVTQLLLQAEPLNSGNYVISSKMYANSTRWDDSAKMRLLMKNRGVSKTPGCSWIEIGVKIHEFHSGDKLNDHSLRIYELLIEDMARAAYVPEVDCS